MSNNAELLLAKLTKIPETMTAAVLEAYNAPLAIKQVPVPKLGDQDVLVKVVCSGICHSDIHVGLGELRTDRLPYILGHEGVGIVVQRAPRAAPTIRLGDRVAIGNINSACQHCSECYEGREQHCKEYKQTGANVLGCYAEYVTIHSRFAVKLPDGLKWEVAAPVACAGHTVYAGVRGLQGVRPGSWVAVMGIGGLGHLAVQYAVAMGYRVIGIDVAEDKLALSKRLGASEAFSAADPKLVSNIMKYTNGGCAGVVVTATHESAFANSVRLIRTGGTIIWIALPNNDIKLSPKLVVFKAAKVMGSTAGSRAELAEAYRMVGFGQVKPIVEVVPFHGVNAAWDRLKEGKFEARMVMEVDPSLSGITASLAEPMSGRI